MRLSLEICSEADFCGLLRVVNFNFSEEGELPEPTTYSEKYSKT
jgi:hypothetical protein